MKKDKLSKDLVKILKISTLVEEEIILGLIKESEKSKRIESYINYNFLTREEQEKLWYRKKYFRKLKYDVYPKLKQLRLQLLSI